MSDDYESCPECGAAVDDKRKHADWHEKLNASIKMFEQDVARGNRLEQERRFS
jgi:hypothetical protein